MTGTVAQIVALTCYGNAFLHGMHSGASLSSNSTFKFCDRVSFVEIGRSLLGKSKERNIADSPDNWLAYLRQTGCSDLWLSVTAQNDPGISDRMSAGFVGGGGTWSLETVEPEASSGIWLSRWEVWNQNAPEHRIWRVTYGRVAQKKTGEHKAERLSAVVEELRAALIEIHDFSRRNNCGGFTECFAKALRALDGDSVAGGWHQDLAPDGVLSGDATRLLEASQHAWVFGGMGSWNDMGFDGEEGKAYDRISERLFRAVNVGIGAAANNSFGKL